MLPWVEGKVLSSLWPSFMHFCHRKLCKGHKHFQRLIKISTVTILQQVGSSIGVLPSMSCYLSCTGHYGLSSSLQTFTESLVWIQHYTRRLNIHLLIFATHLYFLKMRQPNTGEVKKLSQGHRAFLRAEQEREASPVRFPSWHSFL